MPRPERTLDRDAGPLAAFAADLRQLRRDVGEPTYRELAAKTHYSAPGLSRAAAGNSLPTLEITRAFVRACGGDVPAWEQRWHVLRRELRQAAQGVEPEGSIVSREAAQDSAGPATGSVTSADIDAGAAETAILPSPLALPTRWTRSRRLGALAAAVAVVVVAVIAGGAWALNGAGRSRVLAGAAPSWVARTQHVVDRAQRPTAPESMDGDDPRARDCVKEAVTLVTTPLLLPDGSTFGSLRLRHDARCGTDWASAQYSNPQLYTVWLAAHRDADAAEVRSQWSNNTPPGSYGDMLSTARGCVWVEAWVVTPAGTSTHVRTACTSSAPGH